MRRTVIHNSSRTNVNLLSCLLPNIRTIPSILSNASLTHTHTTHHTLEHPRIYKRRLMVGMNVTICAYVGPLGIIQTEVLIITNIITLKT